MTDVLNIVLGSITFFLTSGAGCIIRSYIEPEKKMFDDIIIIQASSL